MTTTELLARVEAATCADLMLDHAIWDELGDDLHGAPLLTASLDAAIALVERVLPGWEIDAYIGKRNTAVLDAPDGVITSRQRWAMTTDKGGLATPALAILAALLRAISEKNDG